MSKPLRVLVVEDSPDDEELMIAELERAGYETSHTRVDQPDTFRDALHRGPWDVILADHNMPCFSAPRALAILAEERIDLPFIIVSGSVSEAIAVESMKAGAHDFFAKNNVTRLPSAVEREVREARMRKERREAFEQIRRAEEQARLIVSNIKDHAAFLLDPEGRVASWNAGAEQLLGYGDEEIIGRPVSVFALEDEGGEQEVAEQLRRALAEGQHTTECFLRRKDGTRFWAECSSSRIDDEPHGFVRVIRDVGERKRLLDELVQAVRVRDEFLSIASHELNTPVTSLAIQLGSAARLLDRSASTPVDKVRQKLTAAIRQMDRLTGLINSLLDVTRITSGKLQLAPERLDLAEVVRDVVARFEKTTPGAGPRVEVAAPSPVAGCWDRSGIDRVVENLLSNALKYGAGKPIEISVETAGDRARLSVVDHGIGIAADEQERIFQRFERAVPERHYAGLGLGLWIVRQIVEAHGGSIHVRSDEGEGSTFTVDLPRLVVGSEHM